jgi:hypothetical protein
MPVDYNSLTDEAISKRIGSTVHKYQRLGPEILVDAIATVGVAQLDERVGVQTIDVATLEVDDLIFAVEEDRHRWSRYAQRKPLRELLGDSGSRVPIYRVVKASPKSVQVALLVKPGDYHGHGDGLDLRNQYEDYRERFMNSSARSLVKIGTHPDLAAAVQAHPKAKRLASLVAEVQALAAIVEAREDAVIAANVVKAEPIREAVEKVNKAFGLKVLDVELDWQTKEPSIKRTSKIPNEVLRLALLGRVYEDAITKAEADAALKVVTTLDHEAGAVDDLDTDLALAVDDDA